MHSLVVGATASGGSNFSAMGAVYDATTLDGETPLRITVRCIGKSVLGQSCISEIVLQL